MVDTGSTIFGGIIAIAGLVIGIVWLVFPFLLLKRLDRAAEERSRQTKLLRDITESPRLRGMENALNDLREILILQTGDPIRVLEHAKRHHIAAGRFAEGESIIGKDGLASLRYAEEVLNRPFPEGEAAIARDAKLSYKYATSVLNARFRPGETAIVRDPEIRAEYEKRLGVEFPDDTRPA